MAAVDIFDVKVLDNPAPYSNPLQFEITYEVRELLKEDIEWKVIYVGSADNPAHDQVLDCVLLPANAVGKFKFVLQVDAPDPSRIPDADVAGVTIVLLTCSYQDKEFVRVGYYVSNSYPTPELNENPPARPLIDQLTRKIAAHEPRVTKFPHNFDYVAPPDGSGGGASEAAGVDASASGPGSPVSTA